LARGREPAEPPSPNYGNRVRCYLRSDSPSVSTRIGCRPAWQQPMAERLCRHGRAWRSPPTTAVSMSPRRRFQVDQSERQRHRDHDGADDRERPEHVDIGEQIDLLLQCLPDPGNGL